jgi:nanoRNase/pAp phosphatase (c-di-AMP/oligoRNAs hydrolase)
MGDSTRVKVSLRSIGDEDTTVVSEAYGGGGHRNASSFLLDAAEFEGWWEA